MHMSDALLSPAVAIAFDAVSAASIGISVAKVKGDVFSEKKIPIMGVAGALVFAGQMINFTIPGTGSSGHIGGGIMLAGLLGGVPAFLSIAAVLIIQCLFFADGGLLALGCNIFNIGVIPCLVVYPLIFKPVLAKGITSKRIGFASIAACVAGLELGALGVIAQTQLSGIAALPFGTFSALMLPIHLAIGIIEGIVTAGVLGFIHQMRPEITQAALNETGIKAKDLNRPIAVLAAMALLTGGVLSLYASANPDGLEWSIDKTTQNSLGEASELEAEGLLHEKAADVQSQTSFLPDYSFAKDPQNSAATSISGIVGAAITFAFASGAGLIVAKIKRLNQGKPAENG
ncbi:MAG: energy-coupling factor ABC transporter permease [Eubacteriaceae bacterium]|nr:energy-coupling factor ABC transporter permease [Eubacteriaceae bacterium]